jgi:hypothetical protein
MSRMPSQADPASGRAAPRVNCGLHPRLPRAMHQSSPGVTACYDSPDSKVRSMFARTSRHYSAAPVRGGSEISGAAEKTAWAGIVRWQANSKQSALNPRVRGSSPWRRTRSELVFFAISFPGQWPFLGRVCSTFARQSEHRPAADVGPGVPLAPWSLRGGGCHASIASQVHARYIAGTRQVYHSP